LVCGHGADWCDAGTHRLAVDQHRASAALRQAATKFGAVEFKVVAERVEQRCIRLGGNRTTRPIDSQVDGHACRLHGLPLFLFFSAVIFRRYRRGLGLSCCSITTPPLPPPPPPPPPPPHPPP